MSREEEYNGWTNRETWAVMLHLDNDSILVQEYNELYDQVSDFENENDLIPDDKNLRYQYSDQLREWVSDIISPYYWKQQGMEMPNWAIGMNDDVGSVWRVDWDSIAHHICDERERQEENE